MTDCEKLLVLKLISAVEDFKLPVRGKLGNPHDMDAERERRATALHNALRAVKEII